MQKSFSDLLTGLSDCALTLNESILAHICRMGAMEARKHNLPVLKISGKIIGIWDWDVVNNRDYLDPGAAEAFGIDAAVGSKGCPIESCLQAVHPDDAERMLQAITSTLEEGGVFEVKYRLISNGRVRPILAKGYCTLDPSGRPERFPGAIQEMSGVF